ncbi:MAG: DNA-3-methyladenine glycosylase [Candidatus Woesearchaeota archaeon]|nr:MAG: DNA-3-methyladenine glycosylase [Candidatus Woesearchaeota archaeon]
MKKLNPEFYARDAEEVAKDLLGNYLVREINGKILKGKIVETEAYYGYKDPASRAYKGKTNLSEGMWSKPGTIFIYNVHNHWMLNFVTGKENEAQAVLIRALEPIEGVDLMKQYRCKDKLKDLCSGPGKLTRAFKITKEEFHGNLANLDLVIIRSKEIKNIETSHRIGVTRDLPKHLRFFIKNNEFVSK